MKLSKHKYWSNRGVPDPPSDVNPTEHKRWRRKYLQDLYIPAGLFGREERKWRASHSVHDLTGKEENTHAIPVRDKPLQPRRVTDQEPASTVPANRPPSATSNDVTTGGASSWSFPVSNEYGATRNGTNFRRFGADHDTESDDVSDASASVKPVKKVVTAASNPESGKDVVAGAAASSASAGPQNGSRNPPRVDDLESSYSPEPEVRRKRHADRGDPAHLRSATKRAKVDEETEDDTAQTISSNRPEEVHKVVRNGAAQPNSLLQSGKSVQADRATTIQLSSTSKTKKPSKKVNNDITQPSFPFALKKPSKSSKRRADSRNKIQSSATPNLQLGITRLCIPPVKQWHNADGSIWQPGARNHSTATNVSHEEEIDNRPISPPVSVQPLQTFIAHPSPKRQKTRHGIFPSATERRLSSIPNNLGMSSGLETFKRVAAIIDRDSESEGDLSDLSSDDEVPDRPTIRGSVSESFADQINEGSPKTAGASPNSQLHTMLREAVMSEESQSAGGHSSSSAAPETYDAVLRAMSRPEAVVSNLVQQSQEEDIRMQDIISVSSDARLDDDEAVKETSAAPNVASLSDPTYPRDTISEASAQLGTPNEDTAQPVSFADISGASFFSQHVFVAQETKKFNLDAVESTQEVYDAVDEVMKEVCDTTRPLPSRTLARTSQLRKDPLLTNSSSRHRELVLEPIVEQPTIVAVPYGSMDSDDDDSMAEVHEERGEADLEGVSTGSTSDEEEMVGTMSRPGSGNQTHEGEDEEMHDTQPARRPSVQSNPSSSALEELSRSPTPPSPAFGTRITTATEADSQRTQVSRDDESRDLPPSPRVIVTVTPNSKRKMTGVTSKHFSNSKASKNEVAASQRSKRAEVASKADSRVKSQTTPQTDLPSTQVADESGDDEIRVASRRRSSQIMKPSIAEQGGQGTVSRRTRTRSSASPSAQPIAFADLTGAPSTQQQEEAPPTSQPNENDEPLDYLAKLLKSPTETRKKRVAPAKVKVEVKVDPDATTTPKRTRTPKKTTGTKSLHFITDRVDLYNTTSSSRRVPAGTSIVPIPALTSPDFGIIQEKLWQEPFWLLIAVTFLNKTTGRAAVPVFWRVKKLFPTPEKLAEADPEVLLEMVKKLGLQNARSKRLVSMAKAWIEAPPVKGKAFRTLKYPEAGDGKAKDVPAVLEEDRDVCRGALEIGHMPGCGAYAYDSWRIFCRDALRGVAEDYDGKGAKQEDFEAEWKRVLPADKELRACLRWMWMREGWVWNAETGEKREATDVELERARAGEMLIEDEAERKFAESALNGAADCTPVLREEGGDMPYEEQEEDVVVAAPADRTSLQNIPADEDEHVADTLTAQQATPAKEIAALGKLTKIFDDDVIIVRSSSRSTKNYVPEKESHPAKTSQSSQKSKQPLVSPVSSASSNIEVARPQNFTAINIDADKAAEVEPTVEQTPQPLRRTRATPNTTESSPQRTKAKPSSQTAEMKSAIAARRSSRRSTATANTVLTPDTAQSTFAPLRDEDGERIPLSEQAKMRTPSPARGAGRFKSATELRRAAARTGSTTTGIQRYNVKSSSLGVEINGVEVVDLEG